MPVFHSNVALVKKCIGDILMESGSLPVDPGPLFVCIQSSHKEYSFLIGTNENDLKPVSSGLTKLLSPELEGFYWTRVYLGMYSSENGNECSVPADFNRFYYKPNQ